LPPSLDGGSIGNEKGFSPNSKVWLKPFYETIIYIQLKLDAIQLYVLTKKLCISATLRENAYSKEKTLAP